MNHNVIQSGVTAVRPVAGRLPDVLFALLLLLIAPSWGVAGVEDADLDGIPDTVDLDDDNDGILDRQEITPQGSDRDTDSDGMPDRLDLDSDQDGILDLEESGVFRLPGINAVRVVGGRLRTSVGLNGIADILETTTDSAIAVYEPLNSDLVDGDTLPDYRDLDSDNDGLFDLIEAGVPASLDNNRDGRIDSGSGFVGADGIDDRYQINNDANCCDYTLDGVQDITPRNTDQVDFPDFQDIDSDNDGVYDLVEAGGKDLNGDGHIDGFIDDPVNPDGVDDALVLVPLNPPDENQDGIPDYIDWQTQPRPIETVDTGVSPDIAEVTPEPEVEEVIVSAQSEVINMNPLAPAAGVADDPVVASSTGTAVQTGLAGSGGCVAVEFGRFDPLFPALLLVAFFWLTRSRSCVLLSSR